MCIFSFEDSLQIVHTLTNQLSEQAMKWKSRPSACLPCQWLLRKITQYHYLQSKYMRTMYIDTYTQYFSRSQLYRWNRVKQVDTVFVPTKYLPYTYLVPTQYLYSTQGIDPNLLNLRNGSDTAQKVIRIFIIRFQHQIWVGISERKFSDEFLSRI